MTRIAIFGAGRIGRMHAENIAAHPRARLAGIYDIHSPAAQEIAGKLAVPQFTSVQEVLDSTGVDAVLIASSTPTHADLIEQSIAAGKPVLCEKPIDLSLNRVNACIKAIQGTDLPFMLGFVRRFDSGHAGVQQAISSGKVGSVHQIVITSRDPGLASEKNLKESGGIFRDMTIHDFDMARFLLGEEIVELSATGSRLVEPAFMEDLKDHDTVSIIMTSTSGAQVIIMNSRRAVYGYDQRIEAFGSAGMVISENHPINHLRLYSQECTDSAPPLQHFFIERYEPAFRAEITAFVEAVEGNTSAPIGIEDGQKALILAEAALRSIRENRTVTISEME